MSGQNAVFVLSLGAALLTYVNGLSEDVIFYMIVGLLLMYVLVKNHISDVWESYRKVETPTVSETNAKDLPTIGAQRLDKGYTSEQAAATLVALRRWSSREGLDWGGHIDDMLLTLSDDVSHE
jgi:hypothetical protein